jgi:hypothetical protein
MNIFPIPVLSSCCKGIVHLVAPLLLVLPPLFLRAAARCWATRILCCLLLLCLLVYVVLLMVWTLLEPFNRLLLNIDTVLLLLVGAGWILVNCNQCWGSVTFWCGSGSADPYLLTNRFESGSGSNCGSDFFLQ